MPFIDGDFIAVHVQEDEIMDVMPVSGGISMAMAWIKNLVFSVDFIVDYKHEFSIFNYRGKEVFTDAMRNQCIAWMNQRGDQDESEREIESIVSEPKCIIHHADGSVSHDGVVVKKATRSPEPEKTVEFEDFEIHDERSP